MIESESQSSAEDFDNCLPEEINDKNSTDRNLFNLRLSVRKLLNSVEGKLLNNLSVLDQVSNLLQLYRTFITSKNNALYRNMQSTSSVSNQDIMNLVLNYYKVLKRDVESTHLKLKRERLLNISQKAHCIFKRDVNLFSKRLELESNGNVTLQFLDPDSNQYTRCVKAFKENFVSTNQTNEGMNQKIQSSNFEVLSVLKLQHLHLSNLLQKSVSSIQGTGSGKIKGLFCKVPSELLHSFCMLGLHVQPRYNTSQDSGGVIDDLMSTWFQQPWYSISSNHDNENNTNTGIHNRGLGVAEYLNKNINNELLKFSKNSSIGNDYDNIALDIGNDSTIDNEITLVALCRVLVNKIATISSSQFDELSHIDQLDSTSGIDFDAISTTEKEEFCLLNPDYVLPEFIIVTKRKDETQDRNTNIEPRNPNDDTRQPSLEPLIPPSYFTTMDNAGEILLNEIIVNFNLSQYCASAVLHNLELGSEGRKGDRKTLVLVDILRKELMVPKKVDSRTAMLEKQTILFSLHDCMHSFVGKLRDSIARDLK